MFHILIITAEHDNIYAIKKSLKMIIRITQNSSLVTTEKSLIDKLSYAYWIEEW